MTAPSAAARSLDGATNAPPADTVAPPASTRPGPALAAAWGAAEVACRTGRRLGDLEFRFVRRLRLLWEKPLDSPTLAEMTDHLAERQRAAREAAERAEWELEQAWRRSGIALPRDQRWPV